MVLWGKFEPSMVRIVPPNGLRRVFGVTLVIRRGTVNTLAVLTGINPFPSITMGCQLPATAITVQVIV